MKENYVYSLLTGLGPHTRNQNIIMGLTVSIFIMFCFTAAFYNYASLAHALE